MTMGAVAIGNQLPCRASNVLIQSNLRWHAICKAATFRVAKAQPRKHPVPSAHGTVCITAAVEAPEARQDKPEPKPQVASSTPLRREEAILFQGKSCISFLRLLLPWMLRQHLAAPPCTDVVAHCTDEYLLRVWMGQLPGWWLVEDCPVQNSRDEG